MSRYIDADKIEYFALSGYGLTNKQFAHKPQIDEIPTADVAPVVHAHWETGLYYDNNEEPCYDLLTCSHCKYPFAGHEYNFIKFYHDRLCPECGAIMDEEVKVNAEIH